MTDINIIEITKDNIPDTQGLIQSLKNLTEVGLEEKDLPQILDKITNSEGHLFAAVDARNSILGTLTIWIQQRLIHKGGVVACIEDVATRKEAQGRGVGSALIRKAIAYAKSRNCYKIILDCENELIAFYERFGFTTLKNNNMRLDLAPGTS